MRETTCRRIVLGEFFYRNLCESMFFSALQPGLDMEDHLRRKAEMLKSKVGAVTLEPHVVVIISQGNKLRYQPTYAVTGPQLFYRIGSIPEAVEIVMKSCFVFYVHFPAAAHSAWTFVQRAVFEMSIRGDVLTTVSWTRPLGSCECCYFCHGKNIIIATRDGASK